MKNVAIIIGSLSGGGAERIAGLLSKKLSQHYHVYFFLLTRSNNSYEYEGDIVYLDGDDFSFEYSLEKNKNKYNIDYSISFMELCNFANILTKGNGRTIISERCTMISLQPSHPAEEYRVRSLYNYADDIVACSHGVRYNLINDYHISSPIHVIYNFIDVENIRRKAMQPLPDKLIEFLNDRAYFVYVGRLHKVKSPEYILMQFAHFQQKTGRMVCLIMVGSGPQKENLEKKIIELNLVQYVKIVSYCDNPFPYIYNSKALILASISEGLPNVILEAMALQCPVISTDCLSGPRELLAGNLQYENPIDTIYYSERGILVSANSTQSAENRYFMASAMEKILSDSAYCETVKKNQKQFMDSYSNEQLLEQWIQIIEQTEPERKKDVRISEHGSNKKWTLIYGTGYTAERVYRSLSGNIRIDAFLVDCEAPPLQLMGLPVLYPDEVLNSDDNVAVYVAVPPERQDHAMEILLKYNNTEILFPILDEQKIAPEELINWIQTEWGGNVCVVGFGYDGQALVTYFLTHEIQVLFIMDNNSEMQGKEFRAIPVVSPRKVAAPCAYIVSVFSSNNKEMIVSQLRGMGIKKEAIYCYRLPA